MESCMEFKWTTVNTTVGHNHFETRNQSNAIKRRTKTIGNECGIERGSK